VSRTLARPPARTVLVIVVLAALVACAGPLPYRPDHQPFGATISADVRVTEERLRVEIDSWGYRVERAVLVLDGNAEVEPDSVVPATTVPAGGGPSIGFGVEARIGQLRRRDG